MSEETRPGSSQLLRESIGLGRRILAYCEGNRFTVSSSGADTINIWSFALLARIVRMGGTTSYLLRKDLVFDAKLIVRALWDSFLDLNLIHSGRIRRSELLDMYMYEHATDWHDLMEFAANLKGATVKALARTHAAYRRGVAAYEAACEWYKRNTVNEKRPRTLRNLPLRDKLEALSSLRGPTAPLTYTVRTLGNAQAHARPSALKEQMTVMNDDTVRYSARGRRTNPLYSPSFIATEAFIALLATCDLMIANYQLQCEFGASRDRLLEKMKRKRQAVGKPKVTRRRKRSAKPARVERG